MMYFNTLSNFKKLAEAGVLFESARKGGLVSASSDCWVDDALAVLGSVDVLTLSQVGRPVL